MKYYGYKILLFILRGFVFLKRGLLWCLRTLFPFYKKIQEWYGRSVGFRLFKINFSLSRRLQKYKLPKDSRLIEVVCSRFALQTFFLLVGIILAIPHSRLYSLDNNTVAGQEILLYALVGPGDQDFGIQEVVASPGVQLSYKTEEDAWNQGALGGGSAPEFSLNATNEQQDIGSISAGGSALLKPAMLSGSTLPVQTSGGSEVQTTKREKASEYEVQPGDVLGGIAGRFGLNVTTLLWANNLTTRSYIRPGDVLTIPPADGLLYKVKKGDTVGKIARDHGVEQSEIIAFNKMQKDGADIVIGEELFLPGAERKNTVSTGNLAVGTSKIVETIRKVAAPPPSIQAPAGAGYIWPTGATRITQYFGWRHTGIDIAGPLGTPNYAAKAGKVIKSQCGWNGGYGCYVILDHGGGITTLYAHNTKLLVSVGDAVGQGDVVGLLGSTGRSTGPHIHFEVRVGGQRVNPLQYIR